MKHLKPKFITPFCYAFHMPKYSPQHLVLEHPIILVKLQSCILYSFYFYTAGGNKYIAAGAHQTVSAVTLFVSSLKRTYNSDINSTQVVNFYSCYTLYKNVHTFQ
jgi:hypothetical protein